ncbi:ABC transporter ATP-binding protein [Ancylobacter polymorphus]|uniref:Iron(III) transport system ATP-binding protein n=1 Tax=Ancylobacter polymorphus TaxID=223390 RepID=A0ABU0B8U0_9HYPH|nr:ABC transporter ATP-binding protein [Ancylobacter polymorphus]MDQ0302225.1 iron(III) transport system ATP-binding protein [Ancylobacter polymorphus]
MNAHAIDASAAAVLNTAALDLHIEGVNLSYGSNHVLKNVNLDIKPGEFFAFLGPSGCGKTTLLRLIAGFNTPDTGRVVVGGRDISNLPPWKRDVGLVFQSYALWPHMTVARNVAFGLEERGVKRGEIQRRVAAALEIVGLGHLAERRPSQLSGGQQQRVALARTVVIEPKVLLLDEPLSNLDAKMRVQVRRELRDLQQRLGLTTIFVTHDQEEANTVCDRIAVMNEGVVQQVGTPVELYERPANLFVATFLGTANVLEGKVTGTGAARQFETLGGLRLPIAAGAEVPADARLVFRPQVARLAREKPAGACAFEGAISRREFLGSVIRFGIEVGGQEITVDEVFQPGLRAPYEIGDRVWVDIPVASALWLGPGTA